MRALDDMVRLGKVLHVGVCNTPAWAMARANAIAEFRGWSCFAAVQIMYNLLEREAERELLPMAIASGLGVTAWAPLACGFLSGKYGRDEFPAAGGGSRRLDDRIATRFVKRTERNVSIAVEVGDAAREVGATPAQVALSWLRRSGVIPILGARTAAQIRENLGCLDVSLSEEIARRLESASGIKLGYPHDFLASGMVRQHLFGGMFDRIETPGP
jgi:aryl-alcohol dehydrogenase-like predicted oxidoreductase